MRSAPPSRSPHHPLPTRRAARPGRSDRRFPPGPTLADGTECRLRFAAPEAPAGEEDAMEEHEELVEETLVEEVSIDGMCGVY
ncbi:hypothetical protein GCM10023200_54380 [Actinomycetospora chlora]|uniref:Mycofactocin n=1 Tax=Actinomycetospora chlora TaxID=663608 RepID=A0ABP9CG13_9PSEU